MAAVPAPAAVDAGDDVDTFHNVVSAETLVEELKSVVSACGGSIPLASFFLHRPELKKALGDKKLKDFVEEHGGVFELVDVKRKDGESKAFGGQGLMLRIRDGVREGSAGVENAEGLPLAAPSTSTPVARTALGVLEKVLVSEMQRVDCPTPHPRVAFMSFNYKVRKKLRSAYSLASNAEVMAMFPTPGASASEEAARVRSLFSMFLLRFAESRPAVFTVTDGDKDPTCLSYHNVTGRCGCNTFLHLVSDAAADDSKAVDDDAKRNEVLEQRLVALLRDVNPTKGVDLAWLGQDNKVRKVLHGRSLLVVLKTLPTFVLERREDRWLVRLSPEFVAALRARRNVPAPADGGDDHPQKRRRTDGEEGSWVAGGRVEPTVIGHAAGLVCLAKPPNISTEALIHAYKRQRFGDGRGAVASGAAAPAEAQGDAATREEVISISRLDKETSGVIPIALSRASEEHMKEQYRTHAVGKRYMALCCGFTPHSGRIESKLLLSDTPGNNRVRVHKNGKPSITEFTAVQRFRRVAPTPEVVACMRGLVLRRGLPRGVIACVLAYYLPPCGKADKFTLVSVKPLTGRTHQIRVHMMSKGHPLVTDFKYGKEAAVKKQSKWCPRNFLHCEMVRGVDHEGNAFEFNAAMPADLEDVVSKELVEIAHTPQDSAGTAAPAS